MGLQHRGQGTWCSGCHCYGDLHHDAGPGATHPAKVKLPRNTWQKELQYWPLQGNPEVSQCWGDAWSGESRSEGMGYTYTNMGKVNWKCGRKITSPNKVNQTEFTNCRKPCQTLVFSTCWSVAHGAVVEVILNCFSLYKTKNTNCAALYLIWGSLHLSNFSQSSARCEFISDLSSSNPFPLYLKMVLKYNNICYLIVAKPSILFIILYYNQGCT